MIRAGAALSSARKTGGFPVTAGGRPVAPETTRKPVAIRSAARRVRIASGADQRGPQAVRGTRRAEGRGGPPPPGAAEGRTCGGAGAGAVWTLACRTAAAASGQQGNRRGAAELTGARARCALANARSSLRAADSACPNRPHRSRKACQRKGRNGWRPARSRNHSSRRPHWRR
jgi:hypothetical protein